MARLSLILLSLLVFRVHAHAEQPPEDANQPLLPIPLRPDAHLSLGWEGDMGFGVRADVPIRKQGKAFNSRDEVALTGGVDFLTLSASGSNPLIILPTVGIQWTLGVTDRFSFYPEFGLVAEVTDDGWRGFYPNIGFGGRYYLWRSIALVGRLGWPIALSAGATF